MIPCNIFYNTLKKNNLTFFAGVPDSLLKDLCAFISDNTDSNNNIITANEGAAVALASGYHLATKKIPVVYMQNSGQGNAINPLVSLADPDVYSIPMLLMIGWRGQPETKDEPQHVKQGRITIPLLETLDIPYEILPEDAKQVNTAIQKAVSSMNQRSAPYALVIKKGTFEEYQLKKSTQTRFDLKREQALQEVMKHTTERDIIISTTGKTSRELFEYRAARQQGHEKDFLTVGSMGHASMIALGIALQKPERKVYCLDGDGAFIMHTGALAIIAQHAPKNFKHIIFNNGAHDSVGGQPTAGFEIDIPAIAKGFGYTTTYTVSAKEEISKVMQEFSDQQGPVLIEIKINKGARSDLGRPTTTPQENKKAFMVFIQ